jgi:hypothetical protein
MRNGLDDGEEGQLRETWQAVLQHSLVAQSVGAIYGDDSLTGDMQQEVELLQEAIESGDFSAFGEHALSAYDSRGDYWKLISYEDGRHSLEAEYDKNGNLIKTLSIEYRDKNGNLKSSVTPEGQEFQNGLGQAESLVKVLGLERARELLGANDGNMANYDNQTLKDVLGLNDIQIRSLRLSQEVSIQDLGASESQMKRLAGEALLKRSGYAWDGNNWMNKQTDSLALKDISLTDSLTRGFINARAIADGGFDHSSATVSVDRDPLSYLLYKDANGPYRQYNGLDSVTIQSYNLDGSPRKSKTFDGWTTVQNSLPEYNYKKGIGYAYDSFIKATGRTIYGGQIESMVGPETVREGDIAWTIDTRKSSWKDVGLDKGDTFLKYSSGQILAGKEINPEGYAGYNDDGGRILIHPTAYFTNQGCNVTGNRTGYTGQELYTDFTNYLTEDLGLNIGYTLLGNLRQKYNPYVHINTNR